jgi:hypothetical protein
MRVKFQKEVASIVRAILLKCAKIGERVRIIAHWHPQMNNAIIDILYRRFQSKAKIIGKRKSQRELIFTVTNAMILQSA